MNLRIVKHYGTQDKEFFGECNTELYEGDNCILAGDEYHNQITTKIEGFIEGCKYAGNEEVNVVEEKYSDESDWD